MSSSLPLRPVIAAAEAAGDLALRMRDRARSDPHGDGLQTIYKTHGPVTEADLAADRLLYERLMPLWPKAGWLSEETADSADRLAREWVWIVDPIDGTTQFINGGNDFGVSVALVQNGAVMLGVIHFPVARRTLWATCGEGAWAGEQRLRVTRRGRCMNLVVRYGDLRKPWLLPLQTGPDAVRVKPLGSTVGKMAQVALGAADAYATPTQVPFEWDIAAGDLIVCEAGGRVTDLKGEPPRYNQPEVRGRIGYLFSNGACHEATLSVLQGLLDSKSQ